MCVSFCVSKFRSLSITELKPTELPLFLNYVTSFYVVCTVLIWFSEWEKTLQLIGIIGIGQVSYTFSKQCNTGDDWWFLVYYTLEWLLHPNIENMPPWAIICCCYIFRSHIENLIITKLLNSPDNLWMCRFIWGPDDFKQDLRYVFFFKNRLTKIIFKH